MRVGKLGEISDMADSGLEIGDAVTEACLDYADCAALVVELLQYFGGSGRFEERLFELLFDGAAEYLAECD